MTGCRLFLETQSFGGSILIGFNNKERKILIVGFSFKLHSLFKKICIFCNRIIIKKLFFLALTNYTVCGRFNDTLFGR